MLYVSKGYVTSAVLGLVCMAAWISPCRVHAQQAAAADPSRLRSSALPASLVDSIRNQTNPYQPRKLQSLLIKPEVQSELEIDRNTYSMVSSAMNELNQKQMELSRSMSAADPADRDAMQKRMEEYSALRAERDRATEDALTEIFPPEKFKRLKQIALQIQVHEAGLNNVLLHGVLGETLDLTDAQRETLVSKAEQYETEKQAKIRQITEEYDAKLLGHLNRKQRQQVDEQLGAPFKYQPVSMERRSFQQLRDFQQRMAPPAVE
jgi:hypothetical protein